MKESTKRPCSWAKCGERRIHHDRPDIMRGHQNVEVPDNYPEDFPCYCSMTCAISDGYLTLRYETPEAQNARQAAWRAERKVKGDS